MLLVSYKTRNLTATAFWRNSSNFLKEIDYIEMPDFSKLQTTLAFSKLLTRMSAPYISFENLHSLNYGDKISIGVDEFETLKIYENSPSQLGGILQTIDLWQ